MSLDMGTVAGVQNTAVNLKNAKKVMEEIHQAR